MGTVNPVIYGHCLGRTHALSAQFIQTIYQCNSLEFIFNLPLLCKVTPAFYGNFLVKCPMALQNRFYCTVNGCSPAAATSSMGTPSSLDMKPSTLKITKPARKLVPLFAIANNTLSLK